MRGLQVADPLQPAGTGPAALVDEAALEAPWHAATAVAARVWNRTPHARRDTSDVGNPTFVVFNPLGVARREVIVLPWHPSEQWSPVLRDGHGRELPWQAVPTVASLEALLAHGCFAPDGGDGGDGGDRARCRALAEWQLHVVVSVPPFGVATVHAARVGSRSGRGMFGADAEWWDDVVRDGTVTWLESASTEPWSLENERTRLWGRGGYVVGLQHHLQSPATGAYSGAEKHKTRGM